MVVFEQPIRMGKTKNLRTFWGLGGKNEAKRRSTKCVQKLRIHMNTTLDDVSAVVGFSATLKLSAWFGDDNSCYIPNVAEDGQLLVKLIGLSAAKKLSEEWPGEILGLPRLRQYEDDCNRRQIALLLEKGFTTRQIATWMRRGERRIQQVCRELEIAGLIDVVGPGGKSGGKKVGVKPASLLLPEKDPHKLPAQKVVSKSLKGGV